MNVPGAVSVVGYSHKHNEPLNNMKIIKSRITEQPKTLFDPMPEVWVTYEDGEEEKLFSYYPDEISFEESEFIGLTRDEALKLYHKKDVAYLRS
jgi:hypothetical protein